MIFLRNLLRARLRSLMTVLGVAVGVALFVSITAITTDLRSQIAEAVGAYRMEVVIYERRATSPFSSRIAATQMQALQQQYGESLTPLVVGTLNERWNAYAMVIGAGRGFAGRLPLATGAVYGAESDQVMLGELSARRLGLKVGGSLMLDGRARQVVGIYRTGSRLFDGAVMANIESVQAMLSRDGEPLHYTMAVMQVEDAARRREVIEAIGATHPRLKVIAGSDFAGTLRLLRVVDAFVNTLAVIALLGVGLIVTNTLLMAIAERLREIGILLTIGWTPWMIVRLLGTEALAICLAGALVGNALALALLRALNRIESVGFGWIPVQFSGPIVLQSLVVSVAVTLLAMLWPALVVWRIQPLGALRHE